MILLLLACVVVPVGVLALLTWALKPRLVTVCALVALATLAVSAFEWSLVDLLTPFLILPIEAAAWIALGACTTVALADLMRRRRARLRAAAPLVICVGTGLLVAFVPFTNLWLDANFNLYRERREEVVRQVSSGLLRPNVEHNASLIALDPSGPKLSLGGNEILVEEHGGRRYVFFFTYRGILDNYSGFLFVPEGGDPREFSDLGETDSTQLVPYGDGWYFAAHL